jgi:hypothetical protein
MPEGVILPMNKTSFDIANQEIKKLGCQILESKYHEETFGSWYITIENEPKIRMVWDGKEEELSVQKMTDETFNGSPVWKTTWSKLKPGGSDLKDGISKLKGLAV